MVGPLVKNFFTPKDVMAVTGLSYRQLQYWDKTGFVKPSYRKQGRYRLYTFSDLIQLKLVGKLRSNRVSIQPDGRVVITNQGRPVSMPIPKNLEYDESF